MGDDGCDNEFTFVRRCGQCGERVAAGLRCSCPRLYAVCREAGMACRLGDEGQAWFMDAAVARCSGRKPPRIEVVTELPQGVELLERLEDSPCRT
jgi:hypothetical protein